MTAQGRGLPPQQMLLSKKGNETQHKHMASLHKRKRRRGKAGTSAREERRLGGRQRTLKQDVLQLVIMSFGFLKRGIPMISSTLRCLLSKLSKSKVSDWRSFVHPPFTAMSLLWPWRSQDGRTWNWLPFPLFREGPNNHEEKCRKCQ